MSLGRIPALRPCLDIALMHAHTHSATMLGADPEGLAEDPDHYRQAHPHKHHGVSAANAGAGPPMHHWASWWFIRTYLQSMGEVRSESPVFVYTLSIQVGGDRSLFGRTPFRIPPQAVGKLDGACLIFITSQDYLDEMKSGASNAIFLVMWPVFNVLLVSSYISKSSHVVIY